MATLLSNSRWQADGKSRFDKIKGWECSQPLEVSVRGIPAFLVPLCFWVIDLCSASRAGWQASVLILLLGALAHAAVPGGSCGSCGCNWEGQHPPETRSQDYSSGIHPGTFPSAFCSLPRNWDLQPTSELLISFVSWKQAWSPLLGLWFQIVRQCSSFLLDVDRELWPLPWELPSVWKLLLFSVILWESRKDLFPFPLVLLKTKPILEHWAEKTNGR